MAHPRSRGENDYYPTGATLREGSSPLTRGKLVTATISILKLRLIPAHAGKTVSVRGGGFVAWAHPRSRGENIRPEGGSPSVRGSSPLTRGKLWVSTIPTDLKGLIPAHAGKTARQGPASRSPRAHPRSRGENRIAVPRASNRSGSSPLTRGKLYLGAQAFAARGLIPAHAGKTSLTSPTSLQAWAHPRSRGENFPASWSMLVPPGSSPLTRGKLTGTFAVREPVGLIPAHAGKTPCARRPRASRRAHPRSRGENTIAFDREKAARGSSPLTRGKPCEGLGTDLSRGLIPAHAGKTCAFRLWGPSPRAHPRSRGENN